MTDQETAGAPERALRVAAAALQLVGSAGSERELMKGLCDLLVTEAGYRLAWVGLARREPERVVSPVAWTGDEEYVRSAQIRWDDGPRGQGPTGRAIREGRPMVSNVSATDSTMLPWAEAARARGYAATCALPLRADGEVIGTVNVYAARENAFDAHEIALLADLVEAAARGIELFRARGRERQALDEVRTARDQLRAIYDASPDMIFVHASDGRLVDVNDVVLARLGTDRETFLRVPPEQLMGEGRELTDAQERIALALELGKLDFEWTSIPIGGETLPVEVRLRRLPSFRGGADEPALVAVVRDLSERKRLEAQMLERAKLESLASFAGGVAHDFNNYLTAALGALSLLARGRGPDGEIASLIDDAIEAASRARGLTRQLLAFARGGVSVPVVFELRPLLEQTERLALAGSAVATRLSIAPELRRLCADPDQIGQVFHNLFLNAAQAMASGGTLTVRASNVERGDARPPLAAGRYVRVEVTDTGPGIDPAHLPRIFDPFFTTKPNGSGLGLPTAFAVVRRHEGDLTVDSTPGVGTSFVVMLPSTDAPLPGEAPEPVRDARALRILLLEDEEALRRVIRRLLEDLGHEVIEAAHGDTALARATEEREEGRAVDVAILDLTIRGGRGGRAVLAELRAILPHASMVGMSGYSQGAPGEGAFDAFLSKPFGVERLEELLTSVRLHRSRAE